MWSTLAALHDHTFDYIERHQPDFTPLGHDKLILCFTDAAGQYFGKHSRKKIKIT